MREQASQWWCGCLVGATATDNGGADDDYFSGVHLFLQGLHSSGAKLPRLHVYQMKHRSF